MKLFIPLLSIVLAQDPVCPTIEDSMEACRTACQTREGRVLNSLRVFRFWPEFCTHLVNRFGLMSK